MYQVIAFYKFVPLPDCASMQQPIIDFCEKNGIKGTILLAPEGINSTIAGTPDGIARIVAFLRSYPPLSDLPYKSSNAAEYPFKRLKVRIKKEIVTMKVPVNPINLVGRYVKPKDWNNLIQREDVIVVDTRNSYEYDIGTFDRAIDPKTNIFSEFPNYVTTHLADKKDRPIAMFCTGGIRCEKATSYLLDQGFKEVYHLDGGILKYLEEIPEEQSLWRGECFIFDEREALSTGLKNRKK